MKTAIIIVGLLGILTTFLPLIRTDVWWIRVFDFPRLQITFVLAATFALHLFFVSEFTLPEILISALLLGSLCQQGYMMFPYTKLARPQVQQSVKARSEGTFSVMFANVLQDNRDADTLLKIIAKANPDIVLTVETNQWWLDQLGPLRLSYPFTVFQPQENTYGMLLFSKLELIDPQIKFLVQDDIPSIHAGARLLSGDEIVLRCLHPRPPFPTEDERSTERDVELLIVGKEAKSLDVPIVVMGDLNDVAWSRTNYLFQDISGLLDPHIGRGFYHTFHADYPFMRFPLDHCFHSNHFRLVDFMRLDYYGSDHFPVYIKLSLEADAEMTQEELLADDAEKKEAAEKLASL